MTPLGNHRSVLGLGGLALTPPASPSAARHISTRWKGGQANHEAHSHQRACTPEEEEVLIQWIQRWHSQNFPIRHEMLRDMARHLILNRLTNSRRNTISTHRPGSGQSRENIDCPGDSYRNTHT